MLARSLIALSLLCLAPAASADVLSPAHCKTQKDWQSAPSQGNSSLWDMYTVGSIKIVAAKSELEVSAIYNFSQCAKKASGGFGWELFNESRESTEIHLIGEEQGWFGISHITVSDGAAIDKKTGASTESFAYG